MKLGLASITTAATVAPVLTGCSGGDDSAAQPVPTATVTETVTVESPPAGVPRGREPGRADVGRDAPPRRRRHYARL